MTLKNAVIVGGVRTPFVKSMTTYSGVSNQEMMTATIDQLAQKYGLAGKAVGDVALGAVMNNASDWNLARESVLGSRLHPTTPAYNIQRACGTSLEATWHMALKIMHSQIDVGIAGGTDTNSDIAGVLDKKLTRALMGLQKAKNIGQKIAALMKIKPSYFLPKFPTVVEPRTGLSMGEHTEKMVKEWGITREAQDQLALESHQKAAKAWSEGFYNNLVFEFKGLTKDPLVRADTSLEKLAKLKPAFDFSGSGTLTAGNSTPLTDGASAVLMCSEEYAAANKLPVLARFVDAQVAAVDYVAGAGLLMAPTVAVSEMLKRNNLSLQDFDFYEIHEAFAGQALCTFKAWESAEYCKKTLGRDKPMGSIDRAKLNVKGGSVALGHPFAATGTRIVASLAKILAQKGSGRGLISICTAGGMGVTAILEK